MKESLDVWLGDYFTRDNTAASEYKFELCKVDSAFLLLSVSPLIHCHSTQHNYWCYLAGDSDRQIYPSINVFLQAKG